MPNLNTIVNETMKILVAVAAAAVIIFLFLNWNTLITPIQIVFLNAAVIYSLWVWLILAGLAGLVTGWLLFLRRRLELGRMLSRTRKELALAKAELDKLRNLTLTEDMKGTNSVSPAPVFPENPT